MPKVASRISPAFFIGAIVCFFFTFAGVSCNTTTARALVGQFANSGSSGSGLDPAQVTPCLDALNNLDIVTYSGINLAVGSDPGTLSSSPKACSQSTASPVNAPTSGQASVGIQPAFIIALAATALAVLVTLLALLRVLRGRAPARLAVVVGVIAIVVLLVGVFQAKNAIFAKITASSTTGSNTAPFDISTLLNFDIGIAFWAAIALLAIGVVLNLPAALREEDGPVPAAHRKGWPEPPPGIDLSG